MIRLRTGTEFLPFPKRLIGPLSALASSGPALRKYRGPRVSRLGLQSSMLLLRWSIVSPRNPVSRMLTETNIHVREHPTRCQPSVTKQNTRFVTLFFIFPGFSAFAGRASRNAAPYVNRIICSCMCVPSRLVIPRHESVGAPNLVCSGLAPAYPSPPPPKPLKYCLAVGSQREVKR